MKNYSKAIAGFVAAAIVAFLGAQDGGVTAQEWLQIVLAGIGGSGLVFIAPKNVPTVTNRNQRGQGGLLYVLAVVALVLLILLLVGAIHR